MCRDLSGFDGCLCSRTGTLHGGCKPFHQKQQTQDDHVSGRVGGESHLLPKVQKISALKCFLVL